MKILLKIFLVGFLVSLLVLIRFEERRFFYDPFMYFFDQVFNSKEHLIFPPWMFLNLLLRYTLNSLLSLLIIYAVFRNMGMARFAGILFLLLLVLLFPLFVYLMSRVSPEDYLAAFYVRRFLAHPVMILILLPAFFYYKLQASERR